MPVRVGWGDAAHRFVYVQFIAHCTVDDLVTMQRTLATLTEHLAVPPIVANFVDHQGALPDILPYFSATHTTIYPHEAFLIVVGLSLYDRLNLRVQLLNRPDVQQVAICDNLAQARALIAPDVYHTEV
ncbi:hypothetical protein G4Y79_24210 [Phototrophicus methaneseepsis]|uniref:Uncharacterized protein n=1 Tax=Phototrophicus methaneseepsis TaxID=2710758 RepID=A0A7S8E9A5_9CHLR|nr:hypothetical protein [Phototrophicus methaneseepsis]QPC82750.1 hypothetical protein G4Y79_24210 [Phototrophicus methaneseepsis]